MAYRPDCALAHALAVPMIGPAGPVGMLSAEIRADHLDGADLISLGTIVAAQLATLALAHPASTSDEYAAPRKPQARGTSGVRRLRGQRPQPPSTPAHGGAPGFGGGQRGSR
ncbi:MAG: hypothetical protein ABI665_18720 [Vicinamibacterales bacterium]